MSRVERIIRRNVWRRDYWGKVRWRDYRSKAPRQAVPTLHRADYTKLLQRKGARAQDTIIDAGGRARDRLVRSGPAE